jgi:nitroreductase
MMNSNSPRPRDRQTVQIVDDVIRSRRTEKILANESFDWQPAPSELQAYDQSVEEALEVARWAPFHYPGKHEGWKEPWRARWLQHNSCLAMADRLAQWNGNLAPGHKFPMLLRACGSCVIVSWSPETELQSESKRGQVNDEHLAATAAFVQNLLIALEARNLGSYWASGNVILEGETPQRLGMEPGEKVTAVVFINYRPDAPESALQRIEGKLRHARDPNLGWLTKLEL